MEVVKRNGERCGVDFNKITSRIRNLMKEMPSSNIDPIIVAQKVCNGIYHGVSTQELDELSSEISMSLSTIHPDYGTLAGYLAVSNLHKTTEGEFAKTMGKLYENDAISDELYDIVCEHGNLINEKIKYERDYEIDYFGIKTLEKSYLNKCNGIIIERPQDMWMRVSLGIHGRNLEDAFETYELMSRKYFTHATPTLFNAGTKRPQLSSCFLVGLKDDSISGIYETLGDCAQISKWAGGIGLHIHNLRGTGADIRDIKNAGSGIVPMLRVYNATARYVNQGGRRPGSIAIYLSVEHTDIFKFLELKKNHGDEEERCRDLFYACWIPDLFMERVKNNEKWSLFCPSKAPDLNDLVGDEYKKKYEYYESQEMYTSQVEAQKLWFVICQSQIETGTPYLLYKDACNLKSNQQNLGVIKSSNLCVAPETMILTDEGYKRIDTLKNKHVNVWNGKQFSETIVKQTGYQQKLLKIKTSNGLELDCTPYHKFYIETCKHLKIIEARKLKIGMKIMNTELPIINSLTKQMKYPYTHGLYCAEKPKYKKKPCLWLNGEKKKLLQHISWKHVTISEDVKSLKIGLPEDIEEKYFVPKEYSIDTKIRWLEGLCDGDGCIVKNQIQICSFQKKFLVEINYLLNTLGVHGYISTLFSDCYRIKIDSISILKLKEFGFSPKMLEIIIPNQKTPKFVRITGIIDENRYDDTYCFTEKYEHKGIFNGIITGQCAEILEYSSPEETAVCNLASIALPKFIENGKIDYKKLHYVAKVVTKNLNKVIDVNYYPTKESKTSNVRHRPIGVGVQGLADVYMKLRIPFESNEANNVNSRIFETIYHGCLESSLELAKKDGKYESFDGSPLSDGKYQFDMWNERASSEYDWEQMMNEIKQNGVRNSLLVALMPTASTSQILGNNECIEPITSNIYVRRTLAGEFVIVNKYLVNDLIKLGKWNEEQKNEIIRQNGSVQMLDIPQELKEIYKTVWEIKQKTIIDQAATRGKYVCQTQSMNLFVKRADISTLSSMHFYSWKKGLKTGVYYLRTMPVKSAIQFTISPECENCSS